jgi:electron transfer flavoprotein alpha subunit
MPRILVVVELVKGQLDDSAWEMASLARKLSGGDGRTGAILLGHGVKPLAEELITRFDDVYLFDSPICELPDGGVYAALLAPLIKREKAFATLLAHTNNMIDLAPRLSVELGTPLLADCIALERENGILTGVRTVYGGKVHARVKAAPSEAGCMATIRPGAFPADAPEVAGTLHEESVPEMLDVKRRTVETIEPEPGAVDISQAEKLIGVGRGIEEEENLEIVQSLADDLGAEVACSRPIVDKKWLEKTRQVGTSGVSVKPKVYLAIGISGSFQHIGGIKGGPFIAAINKDPRAPIFGVADVGIVGDLFDIVPLLEEKIREAKG